MFLQRLMQFCRTSRLCQAFVDSPSLCDDCVISSVYCQVLIRLPRGCKRSRNTCGQDDDAVFPIRSLGQQRSSIAAAAKVVHQWLEKPWSPLRDLLAVLSDGGTYFCASTHCCSAAGAVSYRAPREDGGAVGIGEGDFARYN